MAERVDPFVFVAATRYASRRWLTAASEIVANQVLVHADVICADAGARGAILDEVDDVLRDTEPPKFGSRSEWEANRARWTEVGEALRKGSPTSREEL